MNLESHNGRIKSVHITALDYKMHELYDAFSYSKDKLKVHTHSMATDYEMHELYDAFSYSKHKLKSVHILRPLIMKCMNIMMHSHIQTITLH